MVACKFYSKGFYSAQKERGPSLAAAIGAILFPPVEVQAHLNLQFDLLFRECQTHSTWSSQSPTKAQNHHGESTLIWATSIAV